MLDPMRQAQLRARWRKDGWTAHVTNTLSVLVRDTGSGTWAQPYLMPWTRCNIEERSRFPPELIFIRAPDLILRHVGNSRTLYCAIPIATSSLRHTHP